MNDYADVVAVAAKLRVLPEGEKLVAGLSAAMTSNASTKGQATDGTICGFCGQVACDSFKPFLSCIIAVPMSSRTTHLRRAPAPVRGVTCQDAGGRGMSPSECEAEAGTGQGRKWLGVTFSADDPPGCTLWEDGNVEFNRAALHLNGQARCTIKGTCLCTHGSKRDGGATFVVLGTG